MYFSLFKGEVDFKVFNTIGLDAYELGNHEFDEGEAHLRDLLETVDFPVIAGNVRPTVDSPLFGADIKPYVVKEIDGEKVAIIGVLKVEKTRESSLVTDAVEFDDEILSVRDHIYTLKDQGINKFIVLSHLGYDFDQVLAESVRDIDVIVGGDTHDVLDSTGEFLAMGIEVDGDYPTVVQDPDGQPVYIVRPGNTPRGWAGSTSTSTPTAWSPTSTARWNYWWASPIRFRTTTTTGWRRTRTRPPASTA